MPSPNVAVGTTDTEAAALAATAAALAAGEDPFGDEDDSDEAASLSNLDSDEADADADTNAEQDDDTDDQADNGEETGDSADPIPEQLEAVAADEPAAAAEVPLFKAQSPAEFKAQREELLAKRAKAFKDYSDGVIEPEEYSRIDSEVFDALEQLTVQRTLHTANAQRANDAWESALENVIATAKDAGTIDYNADGLAAKQFDMATAMLKADGKQRTAAQLAQDAHKAVLALRGISATTPAAGAKPRENGKPPVTLRSVPAADVPNAGGGWMDQLNKLTGQDYEAAFARLTPAQQAQVRGD